MKSIRRSNLFMIAVLLTTGVGVVSCDKEEEPEVELKTATYQYHFHNGQTVESAPYVGGHPSNLSAEMTVDELENGGTKITVEIENSVDGQKYMIHAHDAADASTTPNGTPYNETPNSDILVQMVDGNGGTVSVSQETSMSFEEITTSYSGFFVIHDPMQAINTANISTYLVVGSFARDQVETSYSSKSFAYDFNTGQLSTDYAYKGDHSDNLAAKLTIDELAGNKSRVTVWLMNTMDGETYHTHSHDAADPTTTPNKTPYNETPNSDVFVNMIMGNGGTAYSSQISSMSLKDLTESYEGFLWFMTLFKGSIPQIRPHTSY